MLKEDGLIKIASEGNRFNPLHVKRIQTLTLALFSAIDQRDTLPLDKYREKVVIPERIITTIKAVVRSMYHDVADPTSSEISKVTDSLTEKLSDFATPFNGTAMISGFSASGIDLDDREKKLFLLRPKVAASNFKDFLRQVLRDTSLILNFHKNKDDIKIGQGGNVIVPDIRDEEILAQLNGLGEVIKYEIHETSLPFDITLSKYVFDYLKIWGSAYFTFLASAKERYPGVKSKDKISRNNLLHVLEKMPKDQNEWVFSSRFFKTHPLTKYMAELLPSTFRFNLSYEDSLSEILKHMRDYLSRNPKLNLKTENHEYYIEFGYQAEGTDKSSSNRLMKIIRIKK